MVCARLDVLIITRKVFRLLKSINENLKQCPNCTGTLPAVKLGLKYIARLSLMLYFVMDNLTTLIKIRVLYGFNLRLMNMRASKFWLIGICFSILCAFIELTRIGKEQTKLFLAYAHANQLYKGEDKEKIKKQYSSQMNALKDANITQVLEIVKDFSDFVTCVQSLGYPKRVLGFQFSDGAVGAAGISSALITCYQIYRGANQVVKK